MAQGLLLGAGPVGWIALGGYGLIELGSYAVRGRTFTQDAIEAGQNLAKGDAFDNSPQTTYNPSFTPPQSQTKDVGLSERTSDTDELSDISVLAAKLNTDEAKEARSITKEISKTKTCQDYSDPTNAITKRINDLLVKIAALPPGTPNSELAGLALLLKDLLNAFNKNTGKNGCTIGDIPRDLSDAMKNLDARAAKNLPTDAAQKFRQQQTKGNVRKFIENPVTQSALSLGAGVGGSVAYDKWQQGKSSSPSPTPSSPPPGRKP